MAYQHLWADGEPIGLPLGKVVCVGRNYAAHAQELNNPIPQQPLLFMKPASSVAALAQPLVLPKGRGDVHYETEIALLIGQPLSQASQEQAKAAIMGVGVALDLTLRALQAELKKQGHPWERAKAFDGACPLSAFVSVDQFPDLNAVPLSLMLNGDLRQQGSSAQMIWPISALVAYISSQFSLQPGDLILTGTPKGVGPLQAGDQLEVALPGFLQVQTEVLGDEG